MDTLSLKTNPIISDAGIQYVLTVQPWVKTMDEENLASFKKAVVSSITRIIRMRISDILGVENDKSCASVRYSTELDSIQNGSITFAGNSAKVTLSFTPIANSGCGTQDSYDLKSCPAVSKFQNEDFVDVEIKEVKSLQNVYADVINRIYLDATGKPVLPSDYKL